MIARAPIVDSKSNLKMNQEALNKVYLHYQCDTFKIDNALVYQILLKMLMEMDIYVYMKQRKSTQDGQAVFFHIPNHFMALTLWQEKKLQTSHYDGEMKGWDWVKYGALNKEQHAIIESVKDYATVAWTMASKSTMSSKASEALSWRQQLMLAKPNQKSMVQILMQPCLI